MPASLTQFHALPEEVLAVVGPFIQHENLHVTAIRFPPFSAHAVDTSTLEHAFMDPSVGRLALTLEAPSLPATSQLSFFDQNPDALWIDIGRIVPNGLRESSFRMITTSLSDGESAPGMVPGTWLWPAILFSDGAAATASWPETAGPRASAS